MRRFIWTLPLVLGAIALIRPFFTVLGIFDGEATAGDILLAALVALIWIGAVVALRAPAPVGLLVLAGVVNAVLVVILEVTGDADLPVDAALFVLLFGAVEGLFYGLIAMGLQRAVRRRAT